MHVTNPAHPGHPGRFFGVPQHSELDFVKFSIDLDTPQTAEIIEKPLKNIDFAMVFMYSSESLRNRKNRLGVQISDSKTAVSDSENIVLKSETAILDSKPLLCTPKR